MRKIIAAILITALITAGLAFGIYYTITVPKLDRARALIQTVTAGNATVVSEFPANDNLEGYLIQSTQNNVLSIVYVDNRGRYLISGTLFSNKGENISEENFQTYIMPQSAAIAFSHLGGVAYIQQGDSTAPHQAYIIFDPNCIYCHRLFSLLQPAIQAKALAIRWIPVAFLKQTSQGRVYAILSNKNPLAALIQNEMNFDEALEEGGLPPLADTTPAVQQELQNNMAFLTQAQVTQVPVLLYKSVKGVPELLPGLSDPSKLGDIIQGFGTAF